jgi:hypothetical protein
MAAISASAGGGSTVVRVAQFSEPHLSRQKKLFELYNTNKQKAVETDVAKACRGGFCSWRTLESMPHITHPTPKARFDAVLTDLGFDPTTHDDLKVPEGKRAPYLWCPIDLPEPTIHMCWHTQEQLEEQLMKTAKEDSDKRLRRCVHGDVSSPHCGVAPDVAKCDVNMVFNSLKYEDNKMGEAKLQEHTENMIKEYFTGITVDRCKTTQIGQTAYVKIRIHSRLDVDIVERAIAGRNVLWNKCAGLVEWAHQKRDPISAVVSRPVPSTVLRFLFRTLVWPLTTEKIVEYSGCPDAVAYRGMDPKGVNPSRIVHVIVPTASAEAASIAIITKMGALLAGPPHFLSIGKEKFGCRQCGMLDHMMARCPVNSMRREEDIIAYLDTIPAKWHSIDNVNPFDVIPFPLRQEQVCNDFLLHECNRTRCRFAHSSNRHKDLFKRIHAKFHPTAQANSTGVAQPSAATHFHISGVKPLQSLASSNTFGPLQADGERKDEDGSSAHKDGEGDSSGSGQASSLSLHTDDADKVKGKEKKGGNIDAGKATSSETKGEEKKKKTREREDKRLGIWGMAVNRWDDTSTRQREGGRRSETKANRGGRGGGRGRARTRARGSTIEEEQEEQEEEEEKEEGKGERKEEKAGNEKKGKGDREEKKAEKGEGKRSSSKGSEEGDAIEMSQEVAGTQGARETTPSQGSGGRGAGSVANTGTGRGTSKPKPGVGSPKPTRAPPPPPASASNKANNDSR